MTAEIWIAFSGKADMRFLRILKPGFRHCFALLRERGHWIVIDPMLHKMEIATTCCEESFDLPGWMRARGYRVIRAPRLLPPRRMAMPSPFTCVEAMKRLIGLHDFAVFTPWQLYRRILSLTYTQGENHGKPVFQA